MRVVDSARAISTIAILLSTTLLSCSAIGGEASLAPSPEGSPTAATSPDPTASIAPTPASTISPSLTPSASVEPSASPVQTPAATAEPTISPSQSPLPGDLDLAEIGWYHSANPGTGSFPFFVGRLDGRAFLALDAPSGVQAAGPVGGKVLAWWDDGPESIVALVDTADGSSRELLRTDVFVNSVQFGADDEWYYVVRDKPGGREVLGIWKGSLQGGQTDQVADGWADGGTTMTRSLDGDRIAVVSILGGSRVYRILETATDQVTVLPDHGHQDVVGFFGEELIVWVDTRMGALGYPLMAIAPDGSQRVIVEGEGYAAAIYPDAAGVPRLVFDGVDAELRHTISVLELGEAEASVIYAEEDDLPFPRAQLVYKVGMEVRGYAPVFPRGLPYDAEPGGAYRDVPRLLVPFDGGPTVDVGPQPSAQPVEDMSDG